MAEEKRSSIALKRSQVRLRASDCAAGDSGTRCAGPPGETRLTPGSCLAAHSRRSGPAGCWRTSVAARPLAHACAAMPPGAASLACAFSPRTLTLKAIRAKLSAEPAREPLPPPKHFEPPRGPAACPRGLRWLANLLVNSSASSIMAVSWVLRVDVVGIGRSAPVSFFTRLPLLQFEAALVLGTRAKRARGNRSAW
jgi:hypothetical protein